MDSDPLDVHRKSTGSFRWTGEALQPDGKAWKLEGEFRARRMGQTGREHHGR